MFEPKCPNLDILDQKVPIFESFNEILSVLYFEGAKSDIGFWKF